MTITLGLVGVLLESFAHPLSAASCVVRGLTAVLHRRVMCGERSHGVLRSRVMCGERSHGVLRGRLIGPEVLGGREVVCAFVHLCEPHTFKRRVSGLWLKVKGIFNHGRAAVFPRREFPSMDAFSQAFRDELAPFAFHFI